MGRKARGDESSDGVASHCLEPTTSDSHMMAVSPDREPESREPADVDEMGLMTL
jgi:hypothetical protein